VVADVDRTVIGHQDFGLSTGAAIPVLIKAVTLPGLAPATASMPFTLLATCATAPTATASSCDDCSCCTAAARMRWA
jgi:hypothetical protein